MTSTVNQRNVPQTKSGQFGVPQRIQLPQESVNVRRSPILSIALSTVRLGDETTQWISRCFDGEQFPGLSGCRCCSSRSEIRALRKSRRDILASCLFQSGKSLFVSDGDVHSHLRARNTSVDWVSRRTWNVSERTSSERICFLRE